MEVGPRMKHEGLLPPLGMSPDLHGLFNQTLLLVFPWSDVDLWKRIAVILKIKNAGAGLHQNVMKLSRYFVIVNSSVSHNFVKSLKIYYIIFTLFHFSYRENNTQNNMVLSLSLSRCNVIVSCNTVKHVTHYDVSL